MTHTRPDYRVRYAHHARRAYDHLHAAARYATFYALSLPPGLECTDEEADASEASEFADCLEGLLVLLKKVTPGHAWEGYGRAEDVAAEEWDEESRRGHER